MATGGQRDLDFSPQNNGLYSATPSPLQDFQPDPHLLEVQSLPDIRNLIEPRFNAERSLIPNRQISVLIFNPWWLFDTYGISSITKSLISNLRTVDPNGTCVKIWSAVLEEEGKIPHEQVRDAEKYKVCLKGAVQPRGKKRPVDLKWLDEDIIKYYQDLVTEKFDFIIGHLPYLADGALNLRDFCKKHRQTPQVILVAHALPLTDDGELDEEVLEAWLCEADLVLSVGGNVWMQIASFINDRCITTEHEIYLPGLSAEFIKMREHQPNRQLSGEQNVLIMVPERDHLEVSGLDFELAVISTVQASQNIMYREGSNLSRQLSFNLKLVATKEEEKQLWEKNFNDIKEKHNVQGRTPNFKFCAPQKMEKLRPHIKRTAVVVLPMKQVTAPFGLETWNALAAGVPVLVSRSSGLASLLDDKDVAEAVVWDGKGFAENTEEWKKRLTQKITNPEEAQQIAHELREILKLDAQTALSHRSFIKYVTRSLCTELDIDVGEGPVSPGQVRAAVKCGVSLGDCSKGVQTTKYITSYLQKLLCGYKEEEISQDVHQIWHETLLSLEEKGRKVVTVGEDKVTLTLFCPTLESWKQLHDGAWTEEVTEKLRNLMESLGVKSQPKLAPLKDATALTEWRFMQALQQMNLWQPRALETTSEGYETMTVSSTPLCEGMFKNEKVEQWLSLRRRLSFNPVEFLDLASAIDLQEQVSSNVRHGLTLVETLDDMLHHVPNMNSFAVSNNGDIAIASQSSSSFVRSNPNETSSNPSADETVVKSPSLSVSYPGRDMRPFVLSNEKEYWSPIFIGNDDNQLATTCSHDNDIRLWNTIDGTSKIVYNCKSSIQARKILCVIDSRTVACHTMLCQTKGPQHRIEILDTDKEPWKLKSVLLVDSVKDIYDMSYLYLPDGTACLLLCSPRENCVQAVEMIGGHVRWESGRNYMAGPLSVCPDMENTVYVADYMKQSIFLLSGEDGALLKSVDFLSCEFLRPFCVCVLENFLFVGHLDDEEKRPRISKFT